MKNIIAIIGFLIMFSGVVLGVYKFNECHDARAEALSSFQLKVEYKFESDYLKEMRTRSWQLKDRCSKGLCTPKEKEELEELNQDLDLQLDKVKEMQKQLQQNRGKGG